MPISKQEMAIRAKNSALEKMAKQDFAGAKKLAIRARNLDHNLPDISQIILVCEVHSPSGRKRERDWYKLLGLDSGDASVKHRCNKMVDDLHNSALPGAAEAFLSVCKAKAVLSARNKPPESSVGDNLGVAGSGSAKSQDFQSGPGPFSDASFKATQDGGGNGKTLADGGDGRLQDGVLSNTEYGKLTGFAAFQTGPGPFDQGVLSNMGCGNMQKSGFAAFRTRPNPFDLGSSSSGAVNAKTQDTTFQNVSGKKSGFAKLQTGLDHGVSSYSKDGESGSSFEPGVFDHDSSVNCNSKGGSEDFGNELDLFGNGNAKSSKADVPKPKEINVKKHGEILLEYSDSELNDFEKLREKECFSRGQIWAVYDTFDAMPRFYARINNIISSSESSFEVAVTWLEPCPENETEKKWLQKGLPASCGRFNAGESENIKDIAIFSHMASSNKDMRLYPKKGETWAIFKNWEEMDLCELEFVEIMSDYCVDFGVRVGFLEKIKGFSTLFSRANVEVKIEAKDKLRFSHRVSSFQMTGPDGGSGFFELDPASLPNDSSFSGISTLSDIFS